MGILWDDDAWMDYLEWQKTNKKKLKKINELIKDTQRSPYEGIGKPEKLKGDLAGLISRRIDEDNRLVYRVKDGNIEILSCKTHYENI